MILRISPEELNERILSATNSLSIRRAKLDETTAGEFARISNHTFWLRVICRKIAVCKHRLGAPATDVVPMLAAEAHYFVTMVVAKGGGEISGERPWHFHLMDVGVVTGFGTREDRAALGGTPLEFCVGEDERSSASARATMLWHELLRTGLLDEHAAQAALLDSEAENADRWERQWVHGILRALLGGARRDPDELNAGLDEVLAFHRYKLTRGGWERRPDDLLCVTALGLMRLGMEAGLPIQVESGYAPLNLLQVEST
jgi:hypothetical protein